MTTEFTITPRSVLIDLKSGQPTRELFRLLDALNSVATDLATLVIIDSIQNGVTDRAPSSNAVYDAVASLSAATSALSASLSADYTPTVNLAALLIEDAINDGEITKAPTENAVFDALAQKTGITYGTFIPTLTSAGATFSYATQTGEYALVGKLCFYHIRIDLNTSGNTLTAAAAIIAGLPFTAGANAYRVPTFTWVNSTTGYVAVSGDIPAGGTTINIRGLTAAAPANNVALNSNAILHATNGTILIVSGVYITA